MKMRGLACVWALGVLLWASTLCWNTANAQALSGTYTIGGSSPNYATINAAITDLHAKGVSGPVTFSIRPGTYLERMLLKGVTGASETNTITWTSSTGNAADVTIHHTGGGTVQDHMTIDLNGASYTQFKYLTLQTLGKTFASVMRVTNKSHWVLIEGCRVDADSSYANNINASIGINGNYTRTFIGGLVFTGQPNPLGPNDLTKFLVPGINGSNITVRNNVIQGSSYPLAFIGNISGPSALWDSNFTAENNVIKSAFGAGIQVEHVNHSEIRNNRIFIHTLSDLIGYGIYAYQNYRNSIIEGNYITNPYSYGMRLVFVQGTVKNNMIAGGFRGHARVAYGISLLSSNTRIINNTVLMDAVFAAAQNNYAFWFQNFSGYAEIYNNIFYHSGGGYAYFVQYSGGTFKSDFNVVYSGLTGLRLLHYAGNDIATLPAWRTATGQDQNSMSFLPQFVGPNDVHTLDPLLDQKGLHIPDVQIDFDKEKRHSRYPDIGADEFVLNAIDIGISQAGPRYAQKGNATELWVTLSNDGKSSLTGKSVNLSWSSDNGTTWSPSESYTIKNLPATFDEEVYKFQNKWTPPQISNYRLKFRIEPALSGDPFRKNDTLSILACVGMGGGSFTVGGDSADFKDLKAVEDYLRSTTCSLEGPLTFLLNKGTFQGQFSFPDVAGASSKNTITFTSASGNAQDALISSDGGGGQDPGKAFTILSNGSYYVWDKLTIRNTSNSYASGIEIRKLANGNVIRNCIIEMSASATSLDATGIYAYATDSIKQSQTNDLLIENNLIKDGGRAIHLFGTTGYKSKNARILNNTIRNAKLIGITLSAHDILELSGNHIVMDSNVSNSIGMFLNQVNSDFSMNANYISQAGRQSIVMESVTAPSLAIISNNMLAGGHKKQEDTGCGWTINSGINLALYHNSILYTGPKASYTTAALVLGAVNNINLLNNIFSNKGGGYAYYNALGTGVNLSNNNAFHTTGDTLIFYGQDYKDLGPYQTASSLDGKSIKSDPKFFSFTDLHTLEPALNGKGVTLAEVPTDFDGQPRDNATPDIGADEFSLGLDAGVVLLLEPVKTGTYKEGQEIQVRVRAGNLGSTELTGLDLFYVLGNQPSVQETFTQTLAPGAFKEFTFAQKLLLPAQGKYYFCAGTKVTGDIQPANDMKCDSITIAEKDSTIGIPQIGAHGALRVYPNPFTGLLFFDLSQNGDLHFPLHLDWIDVSGRSILRSVLHEPKGQLDASGLEKGVYQLIWRDNSGGLFRSTLVRE